MKLNFYCYLMMSSSILFFVGCSKNTETTTPASTIVAKWTPVSSITWTKMNSTGVTTKDTTIFLSGSFVDLKSDGTYSTKFITKYGSGNGSGTYSYSNNVIIGFTTGNSRADTATVNELTNNSLKFSTNHAFINSTQIIWDSYIK